MAAPAMDRPPFSHLSPPPNAPSSQQSPFSSSLLPHLQSPVAFESTDKPHSDVSPSREPPFTGSLLPPFPSPAGLSNTLSNTPFATTITPNPTTDERQSMQRFHVSGRDERAAAGRDAEPEFHKPSVGTRSSHKRSYSQPVPLCRGSNVGGSAWESKQPGLAAGGAKGLESRGGRGRGGAGGARGGGVLSPTDRMSEGGGWASEPAQRRRRASGITGSTSSLPAKLPAAEGFVRDIQQETAAWTMSIDLPPPFEASRTRPAADRLVREIQETAAQSMSINLPPPCCSSLCSYFSVPCRMRRLGDYGGVVAGMGESGGYLVASCGSMASQQQLRQQEVGWQEQEAAQAMQQQSLQQQQSSQLQQQKQLRQQEVGWQEQEAAQAMQQQSLQLQQQKQQHKQHQQERQKVQQRQQERNFEFVSERQHEHALLQCNQPCGLAEQDSMPAEGAEQDFLPAEVADMSENQASAGTPGQHPQIQILSPGSMDARGSVCRERETQQEAYQGGIPPQNMRLGGEQVAGEQDVRFGGEQDVRFGGEQDVRFRGEARRLPSYLAEAAQQEPLLFGRPLSSANLGDGSSKDLACALGSTQQEPLLFGQLLSSANLGDGSSKDLACALGSTQQESLLFGQLLSSANLGDGSSFDPATCEKRRGEIAYQDGCSTVRVSGEWSGENPQHVSQVRGNLDGEGGLVVCGVGLPDGAEVRSACQVRQFDLDLNL